MCSPVIDLDSSPKIVLQPGKKPYNGRYIFSKTGCDIATMQVAKQWDMLKPGSDRIIPHLPPRTKLTVVIPEEEPTPKLHAWDLPDLYWDTPKRTAVDPMTCKAASKA